MNINIAADLHEAHETPIKRMKEKQMDFKTAQSEQALSLSLENIDAKDLFERFSDIVRVSEQEYNDQEQFQTEIQRKLDYEMIPNIKLDFEPKSSSMKKKSQNAGFHVAYKFKGINLFEVLAKKEDLAEKECDKQKWIFDSPVASERQSSGVFSRAPEKQRSE